MSFNANEAAALRTFFEDSYPDLVFKDHPLMGLANKPKRFGDSVKVPVKFGYGPGRGGTFTTAQTNAGTSARKAFLVPPPANPIYGVEDVPNANAIFTGEKSGAVIDLYTDAMASGMKSCSDQVEEALFASGFGELATISSFTGVGPWVITLTIADDAYKFEPAFVLVTKATAASGALDTGTIVVTGVDPNAGTISVTGAGGFAPTNGHVIGVQGSMQASTTATNQIGLAGWLPLVAPTVGGGDNFYSVDRSANPIALAGNRMDLRAIPNPLEQIKQLAIKIAKQSKSKPDVALCNFDFYGKCLTALDNKAVNIQTKADSVTVYYDGIKVQGPKGPIAITPAVFCPGDRFYILDSSTVNLGAPGDYIQPATRSGDPVDLSGSDSLEFRYRGTGFFWLSAPGNNGVGQIA